MNNQVIKIVPEQIYYPAVNFNYQTGICEISGETYMEDTYRFYEPLINWLRDYTLTKRPILFNFKLIYFNTSSSRFVLEILDILKAYQSANGKVDICWFYKTDDPDILAEINDFSAEVGIEIKTIPFD